MKIQALSLVPPPEAAQNPQLTPELLASVFARYSRSNDGLDLILSKVDLTNPTESIGRILKFIDYGHASIGGMVAGLAIAFDGISMFAAYKIFELAQMADGQEGSTRYIPMNESGLPDWSGFGFSTEQASRLQEWSLMGISLYERTKAALDKRAEENPSIVRIPAKLANKPAAVKRLRVNYGLDRTRYFLPFAMKTNMALVMSARMWTEVITGLLSANTPELTSVADQIKHVLTPYAPHTLSHGRVKAGWTQARDADNPCFISRSSRINYSALHEAPCAVSVFTDFTDAEIAAAISSRENRYDRCGIAARDTTVRITWNGMSIAELRDLNRHRTGSRFAPLFHVGLYLPTETKQVLAADTSLQRDFCAWEALRLEADAVAKDLIPYTLCLGSIVPAFRHTTQLDKVVYTTELRTGAGAHFRYADHYGAVVDGLRAAGYPLTAAAIQVGDAEPE